MFPAVFVDRDNTLIDDMGYSADPDRVRLKPGASECVQRLRRAGYFVIVVTNQSGVARGYFSEEQLAAAHKKMQELLLAHSTGVDAVYYCPFLDGPDAIVAAYRRDSELRKPRPGMLLQAADELQVDLRASWMIGDAMRDIEAGRTAGCRTILLGQPPAGRGPAPDYTAADLQTAADIILSNGAASGPNSESPPAPVAPAPRPAPMPAPPTLAHPASTAPPTVERIEELLAEVRQWRREARRDEYGAGHLVGAIAQVFAVAGLFWGLYGIFDANKEEAVVRFLAAAVFQMIALTYLRSRR